MSVTDLLPDEPETVPELERPEPSIEVEDLLPAEGSGLPKPEVEDLLPAEGSGLPKPEVEDLLPAEESGLPVEPKDLLPVEPEVETETKPETSKLVDATVSAVDGEPVEPEIVVGENPVAPAERVSDRDPNRLYCPKCGESTPKPPIESEVTHRCSTTKKIETFVDGGTGQKTRSPIQSTSTDSTTGGPEMPTATTPTKTRSTKKAQTGATPVQGVKAPAKSDRTQGPAKTAAPKATATPRVVAPKATAAAKPVDTEKAFPAGAKVEFVSVGWSTRGWMIGKQATVVKPGRARIGVKFSETSLNEKCGEKFSDASGYAVRPETIKLVKS